ncbi:hypothetical protein ACSHWB_18235 [Lentzea sp. HUAS TT2]|uniref:hypothetical protein n=1 Tax=Lentzea sp. HUAS TT2 TaxID=3447454 RepID=UPI003F70C0A9
MTNTTSIGTTVPIGPTGEEAAPLDALPYLVANLSKAPDLLLRRLIKITRLGVRLNDDHDQLLVTLRLPSEHLSEVAVRPNGSPKRWPQSTKRLIKHRILVRI